MQTDLIFRIGRDAFLLLPGTVFITMQSFIMNDGEVAEAGGILLGSYRGRHIQVTSCTTPKRQDVRKRFLFDRKDAGHQFAAKMAWINSGGKETFVGEWHTHPEDNPQPSSLDRETWFEVTMNVNAAIAFLIIGRKGMWAGVGCDGNITVADLLQD